MAQVTVSVNGRRYDITCDDGQEAHVFRLAEDLDGRVARLVASVGQVGDARLLLLVGLMLADELVERGTGAPAPPVADSTSAGDTGDAALGAVLTGLARRIDAQAERLRGSAAVAAAPDPS